MKPVFRRASWFAPIVLVAFVVLAAGLSGCFQRDDGPVSVGQVPDAELLSAKNPQVQSVMGVQDRHTPTLMADPEVIGTATGLTDDGRVAVMVLVTSDRAAKTIPLTLEGTPVRVVLTDPIIALKGGGVSHTARQARPIELGTSGGNALDLANGFCCSGTLGSLVHSGSTQYILSNSHVFAGDIANSGGDPDVAQIGNPINQPGLIDVNCQNISADYVANLSSLSTLNTSANVDCAIAQVISGAVRTDGSILEVGVISATPIGASVGQAVKKSGRTSGLTRSSVSGINATVNVGYEDECNGQAFSKVFTGQILVNNRLRSKSFLSGGDSGSLMVQDVTTNPRAVGLLYAGSSSTAVANPIGDVLAHHGVSLVGN
jgi:hypothetical protein